MRMLGRVSISRLAIADCLGGLDGFQSQRPADAVAAQFRIDIEAFHLAGAFRIRQGADSDATRRSTGKFRKEQPALRLRIAAGQERHFLFEILERQVDAQPGREIAEILADLFQGFSVVGSKGADRDHGRAWENWRDPHSSVSPSGGPSAFPEAYFVSAISSRPISIRRISEVPAPISYSLASRHRRPVGYSLM